MRWAFWRRRRAPNYAEFLDRLYNNTHFGEEYDDHDTASDFRRVFLRGDDNGAGKRVLYSILAFSGLYRGSTEDQIAPLDGDSLNRIEGRMELGRHILALTYARLSDPMEKPDDREDLED